jgi:TolB-like protein/Tfp pilus assembly protein PilF
MSLWSAWVSGFYEFGPFRLDTRQRLFERDGERIPLAPKVLETLLVLVEMAGKIVEKEELLKRIWPDAFVEEGSLAQNISILRKVLGESMEGEPYIETIPKRGYRFTARFLCQSPTDGFRSLADIGELIPSIAVLPFANMSGDPDQEYFSDGLAEEIINALAQIPGLKVTARTSTFAFRGRVQDITKIGQVLRVRSILEGSVRKSGNRVRVTVQLINTADGYHLWGCRYDRDLADLFAVQDEIAAAIVEALQVKLFGEPAARPYQPNLRAYDLFLKGRHELSRITPESSARAKELLEEAIALDPGYSEPHAELGQYYYLRAASGRHPAGELMEAARAHAHKALELNATDPRAHALLCCVASVYDHDWNEAEHQFRLALAVDPVLPAIRGRCAFAYLLPLGCFKEALFHFERALEQDPLSPGRSFLVWTLVSAGLYDRALAEARKCLEFDENQWFSLLAKSLILVQTGADLTEARLAAEKGIRAAPWCAGLVGLLAGILARMGEVASSEELVAKLRELPPAGLFWYQLLRTEIDAAADCYARMIERCDVEAILFAAAGFLKPLRSSPRWPALAKMMNLPEQSR